MIHKLVLTGETGNKRWFG